MADARGGDRTMSLMERFAEPNTNKLELTGAYDPATQRWRHDPAEPSMRTNYETWNQTQRTTQQHTAGGDVVPDYPSDQERDFVQD